MRAFLSALVLFMIVTVAHSAESPQKPKSCPLMVGGTLVNVAYILDVEDGPGNPKNLRIRYLNGDIIHVYVSDLRAEKQKIAQAMIDCQAK